MKYLKFEILNFKFCRRQVGFTIVELIISVAVTVIIFSFVLANFRVSQTSAELGLSLKQIISAIDTVRSFTLAGKVLADGSFPLGGYGIEFGVSPSDYRIFAVIAETPPYYYLDNEHRQFLNTDFYSPLPSSPELGFWASGNELKAEPECYIGNYLRVVFASPDNIYAVWDKDSYPCEALSSIKYVGATLKDKKNGRQAYFYISLLSGMVSGSLIYD